jgi:hypothetical protein
MIDVIFYSTGEIFWVSDPPFGKPHIGVPHVFPDVPPDHLFTYSRAAHTLTQAGMNVIGAFGRQRKAIREAHGQPDPRFLALAHLPNANNTVLVLIVTESGSRDEGGVDTYRRIPFTQAEVAAFAEFRRKGGGVYVTWDHGPLGYRSLKELGLDGPVEEEPDTSAEEGPYRPNVEWSHDSTDEARVKTSGSRFVNGKEEPADVWLTVGPPAGYLQKIVPAQILGPNPQTPHPIFNGVGGADGIWIPAHMHEGRLKVKASLRGLEEFYPPEQGIHTLAVHVPFTETIFVSFAVMAYQNAAIESGEDGFIKDIHGPVIWDTSFHHLVDINWSSDGKVPWDPFVPFSAQALWKQQLPPALFEERLERGMNRMWVNAVRWLGTSFDQLAQVSQVDSSATLAGRFSVPSKFVIKAGAASGNRDDYPCLEDLRH